MKTNMPGLPAVALALTISVSAQVGTDVPPVVPGREGR
jgi:hypothetical protein